MNVIFTCGGTGGHINPAIAVANAWKERHPDSNILFIGAKGNMEERLVPKAGFPIETIPAAGLARGISPASLKHNLKAVKRVYNAVKSCKQILRDFGADVIVGTGGWASFPSLLAGKQLKIPVCVHEANALPGLTTRMAASWADKVLVCFPESARYYKKTDRVEVVGMPVRREFVFTQKEAARKQLGLDDRPLIVSAFGSQGARAMNEVIGKMLKCEQDAGYPYQHIHAIGSYGMQWVPEYLRNLGVDAEEEKGIRVQEYIYNMPTVMAAADVVISRAGASTCNEIAASGTPCVLIPSPNVTNDHQMKNAAALAEQGAAVLLPEEKCTAESLLEAVSSLLNNRQYYEQMRRNLLRLSVPDSAQRVCAVMEELIRSSVDR